MNDSQEGEKNLKPKILKQSRLKMTCSVTNSNGLTQYEL
jgi:hypothetical protein